MGKKRRAISRPRKFAEKYFSWLDTIASSGVAAVAGARTDKKLSSITPFIDKITITDKGNQTINFVARLFGNVADGVDTIKYSINGAALSSNTPLTVDNGSADLDEYTASSAATCVDSGGSSVVFPVGKHRIEAQYFVGGNAGTAGKKTAVEFSIAETKIVIDPTACADSGAGNITITPANLVDSGYKIAGLLDNWELATNGFQITATDEAGAVVTMHARADVGAGASSTGDLLASDVGDGTKITLTIIPKDSDGDLLTASTVTHVVTVTA